jgi:hypothetical protein
MLTGFVIGLIVGPALIWVRKRQVKKGERK